jgi:hypothetical protein
MHSTRSVEDENSVNGALNQIVGKLDAARQRISRARVLGIAGCRSGDGATFVLDTLAKSLAVRSPKGVLRANCGDLLLASHLRPSELLAQCSFTQEAGLWLLSSSGLDTSPALLGGATESDLKSAMAVLCSRFDFVLLDCGAVNASGRIWQLASIVDDVLLVVAAGETRRNQISYAQRIIAQSGAHLSGCILNKRTYPLPGAIHRLLN